MINYNVAFMDKINPTDANEFENNFEIAIHELTHVLGFSNDYIKNFWFNKSKG
jgi:hypothetical protein